MGNCLCQADESTLNTPVGNCSIKHCNCWGKKEIDPQLAEIEAEIIAHQHAVGMLMRQQMLANLKTHGTILPVQVHDGTVAVSPRSLSVRIKTTAPD